MRILLIILIYRTIDATNIIMKSMQTNRLKFHRAEHPFG